MKSLIYLAVFIGGLIGSYVPVWFHASYFSWQSILGGAIGSILGVWAAVKFKDYF